MNTNLPISQADLEAMRIGPARAAAEMEGPWAMTVDAREPRSGTKKDFQSALMQAGLLQGTGNVQPTAIYGTTLKLYSYDEIFSPKETTNGKTEDNRSQIDSAESHGQIRLTDKFEIPLLSIAIQHEINRINETQRRTKDSRKKLNQNFALETYEGILRAIEGAQ